jgi:hypothetical protein
LKEYERAKLMENLMMYNCEYDYSDEVIESEKCREIRDMISDDSLYLINN